MLKLEDVEYPVIKAAPKLSMAIERPPSFESPPR